MAESRSATRGRQGKRKSFSEILAGPHYWITVHTKSGRVVRIPVEGKSRRKVGKSKAGAAKVRPFGGTAGRDVAYRAKGQGGAAKPPTLTAEQLRNRERAQAAIGKHVDARLASARKRAAVSVSSGKPSGAFDAVADLKRRQASLAASTPPAPSPARPSVREQAAARRASKGTDQERARAIAERLRNSVGALRAKDKQITAAFGAGRLKQMGLTFDQAKARIIDLSSRAKKRERLEARLLRHRVGR